MASEHSRRASSWLTVQQLSDALDIGTDYCRREVLRRTPDDAKRREGRKILVHGRTAIECWLKHRVRSEVEKEHERDATSHSLAYSDLLFEGGEE